MVSLLFLVAYLTGDVEREKINPHFFPFFFHYFLAFTQTLTDIGTPDG
jgi:hypothetical protein